MLKPLSNNKSLLKLIHKQQKSKRKFYSINQNKSTINLKRYTKTSNKSKAKSQLQSNKINNRTLNNSQEHIYKTTSTKSPIITVINTKGN